MDNEYISIKDFALKAGKSQQAIYKQVERKLQTYIKLVDNQKMIDIRALQEVYGIEIEQPIQPKVEQVEQPIQPNFDSILSQNQQMIDMLKEQLEAKDKQIENLQKLLDQEQQLRAIDKQKIEVLEQKEPQEETPQDKQKKKWWNKFF